MTCSVTNRNQLLMFVIEFDFRRFRPLVAIRCDWLLRRFLRPRRAGFCAARGTVKVIIGDRKVMLLRN